MAKTSDDLSEISSTAQDSGPAQVISTQQARTSIIAIKSEKAIVFAVDRSRVSKLQEIDTLSVNTCVVNDHIIIAYAGESKQAESLIKILEDQLKAENSTTQSKTSVEYAARSLSAISASRQVNQPSDAITALEYLVAGFDQQAVLYRISPNGSVASWKSTAIGSRSDLAIEQLEEADLDKLSSLGAHAAVGLAIDAHWTACKSVKLDLIMMNKTGEIKKLDLNSHSIKTHLKRLELEPFLKSKKEKRTVVVVFISSASILAYLLSLVWSDTAKEIMIVIGFFAAGSALLVSGGAFLLS